MRRSRSAKPDVFERIKRDFDAGDFEKARDRLHGLVNAHPEDLELRGLLGDVYARLGDPVRAGQFWYFIENKTHEMLDACKQFERHCGNHPPTIAKRLRWSGDIESVPCPRAREMLKQRPVKREAGCGTVVFGIVGLIVLLVVGVAVVLFLIYFIKAVLSDSV
jgi:hypothetical protein